MADSLSSIPMGERAGVRGPVKQHGRPTLQDYPMPTRPPFSTSRLLTRPIAHRGLHHLPDRPENSLAAFQAAIDHNYAIELDVHLLADGHPVVFHDHTLLRMTGIDRPIAALTAAEARATRLLDSAEPIPLLEDVLALVASRVPLLIETKSHGRHIGPLERAVLSAVSAYSGEFAVQSFNPLTVLWFRMNAPHIWRGQLSSAQHGVPIRRRTRPDFVAYNIDSLPFPFTASGRKSVVPLIAWTIRTPAHLDKAPFHADNFIFDATDVVMARLEPMGER